jgi:hypothetical protein
LVSSLDSQDSVILRRWFGFQFSGTMVPIVDGLYGVGTMVPIVDGLYGVGTMVPIVDGLYWVVGDDSGRRFSPVCETNRGAL